MDRQKPRGKQQMFMLAKKRLNEKSEQNHAKEIMDCVTDATQT